MFHRMHGGVQLCSMISPNDISSEGSALRTAPNTTSAHVKNPNPTPFTIRIPAPGEHDPYFGCSRTWWSEKLLPCPANGFKPPITSFTDRKPGKLKGVRFILFESAIAYFERLSAEQSAEPKKPSDGEAA